jgi:hypothetical protein
MKREGLMCVVYTRVSHEKQPQADGEQSLRTQEDKARAWIELKEGTLVKICADEAISAKSLKGRDRFQGALQTPYVDEAVFTESPPTLSTLRRIQLQRSAFGPGNP